jgi:Trehalase
MGGVIMRRFNLAVKMTILVLVVAFTSPSAASDQNRVLIDAYDPASINGLVLIGNGQNVFALRFLLYRPGGAIEEAPRSFELGAHAPDGSYASVNWQTQFNSKDTVVLRWSRVGQNVVVGRLSAPPYARIAIEVYRPWSESNDDESWVSFLTRPDKRTILGEQITKKNPSSLNQFFLRTDRPAGGSASYEDRAAMRRLLIRDGHAQQPGNPEKNGLNRYAVLSYDLSQVSSVGFVALVGDSFDAMERDADKLLQRPLLEPLDRAEKRYEAERAMSGGSLGDGLEAISRTLNWNRFYDPEKQLEYIAIHRLTRQQPGLADLAGSGPSPAPRAAALSWDTFLTAATAAVIDPGLAASTIRVLLEGQMPDGRLPLRRYLHSRPPQEPGTLTGRSMPPIGALCVWKIYLTTSDLELLAWAYPRLLEWNDWWFKNRGDGQPWRDGNGDGLLEWGFDPELEQGALGAQTIPASTKLKLALSESGLDDRPQWPQWTDGEEIRTAVADSPREPAREPDDQIKYNNGTHTLEFSPVALNALYAIDTEILVMMARELNLASDINRLQERYERIRFSVNNKLWSEEDGLYLNRRWDGKFSRRLSLENFYPLLAGLADEDRAKRMIATLSKKFWGGQPMAFIARDDPAFRAQTPGRGAVWSITNYLLYIGLKRYRFQEEAAELARRSTLLGRSSWEKDRRLYDHYSSLDGTAIEENDLPQHPSTAGLMFWPGIEELISIDLWNGMSIGGLSTTEEARIERVRFSGARFDVILGPKQTQVRRDGSLELEFEAPVRLRFYRSTENSLAFFIDTRERVRVSVPGVEERKITVLVDDQVLGSTSAGATATFKVSEGTHKVFIAK